MARENRVGVSLHRTAAEVKNYRVWMRRLPLLIGVMVLILIIGYVLSVIYMKFGAFTVMVNKFDHNEYALTLSESPNFESYTSRLNAEISETLSDMDGRSIPDWVDNVDGKHNGDNYVAYTFYCTNAGIKTVTYSYNLYIANQTYEVEKAVRVRLYVDENPDDEIRGEYVDYAYARTDGGTGPEPGTTSFKDDRTIVEKMIEHFKPGDKTKFTLVIWLEGNDPDCVDKILGGEFKVDMKISVVAPEDENKQ